MTCLFGCHLRNHAETIALHPFVVNKWQLLQNIASLSHECSTWRQNCDVMESIGEKLFPPRGSPSAAYWDSVMATWQSVIWLVVFWEIQYQVYPHE